MASQHDTDMAPPPEAPPLRAPVRARDGETLAQAAYEVLRADIIAGVRPPAERLRIDRLKGLYDIGPTPLREALQRLSAVGFVEAVGNRGFSVAPLDIGEFEDLNIARTALEKEALRLSLRKGDDDWEASVVAAAYRMDKEDRALQAGGLASLDEWERANGNFHLAMVAACGSQWLLKVRRSLHDQCERYRRASVGIRRGRRDLRSEHAAIAEAVIARDADRACALTEEHFATTTRILAEEMDPSR